LLDHERRERVSCLGTSAVVTIQLGLHMRDDHARCQLPRVDERRAQNRVLVRTGMNNGVLAPDLRRALQVAASDVYERGVLVEQGVRARPCRADSRRS